MIARLIAAGMDVARLNFSHGTHAEHAQRIRLLREAARQADRPLGILQDLQGPKIRTGKLKDGQPVQLRAGDRFVITTHEIVGTAERVSTTYQALPQDVEPGDRILLSDGLIELRVIGEIDGEVETTVVFGGELRENQGINLPGVKVSAPALTEKDIADLEFGLTQGVDYVAISFVRRAADLKDVKERIKAAGKNTPVCAKIEKPEALDDLTAILEIADAIMVARGDLGVEMAPEQVPVVQKQLIDAAGSAGVPVITATQMLDSMIRNPRPTRAEASDVANAIIDGTDAVMLSGETANGLYPIESVEMMSRIAEAAEASGRHGDHLAEPTLSIASHSVADAISAAACAIVQVLPVRAIIPFTMSGKTALMIANLRPVVPILAFTPSMDVYNALTLVWGVTPIMCDYIDRLDALGAKVNELLVARGFAQPGDQVVVAGGHPIAARGATNFVKVLQIDG
jgi:pyruvate kinase